MFDVIAYLIETFQDLDACPPRENLGEHLSDAGFEGDEIHSALLCLDALTQSNENDPFRLLLSSSIRIYSAEELDNIDTEILNLLLFLEKQSAINPVQREMVIHALMHLPNDDITMEYAKLLTLVVLWLHKSELPVLIGDELLVAIHGQTTMH